MKWFEGIKDLNELRREYYRLALMHHPDRGGDTAIMQQINNLYELLSKKLIHQNFTGNRAKFEEKVINPFAEMIAKVFNLKGVDIEIIGSWLWLIGETKQYKEYLKEIGFRFSASKVAWYWHHGGYYKKNGKRFGLDEIRSMWGTENIKKDGEEEDHKRLSA